MRMEALTRLGRLDEALAEGVKQRARAERNGERLFDLRLAQAEMAAREAKRASELH